MISIAVSWSVARMRPISEVSEVPARPANSSAVITGPSSLQQSERGGAAEHVLGAEALQQLVALQPEHHADEQAREHDDDERAGAGVVDLGDDQARACQRRHALPEQAHQKERRGSERRTPSSRMPLASRLRQQLRQVVRRRVVKGHRTLGAAGHELAHRRGVAGRAAARARRPLPRGRPTAGSCRRRWWPVPARRGRPRCS